MADAVTTTTRRAMLGVLASAPLIAALPVSASPTSIDRAAWDFGMAAYETAKRTQVDAYTAWKLIPFDDPRSNPVGEKLEVLCTHLLDAEDALLRIPAPDTRALLWKLEFLFKDQGGQTDAFPMAWVTPAPNDARRLLGGGAA